MTLSLNRETAFKAVSALIVIILGTQFVVGFVNTGRWGWPMVAYSMYRYPHYEGERFAEYDLYAILADSTRVRVDPGDLNMGYWLFLKNAILPVLQDQLEDRDPLIGLYCERSQGELRRFELFDRGAAITVNGPVTDLEPALVATLAVDCK